MIDELTSVLKEHAKLMRANKVVGKFYAKIKKNTASYTDLLKVSEISGGAMADIFMGMFPDGIPPDMAEALLSPALRRQCQDILRDGADVQRIINAQAGLSLNPVEMKVNEDRIRGLVEHIVETGFGDEAKVQMENLAQSHVDDTMEANANFQAKSGLRVTVSRQYDGKGLSGGRQCEWCISRVGDHVPIKEASRRGMFERHPGCGCTIEYHTEKVNKIQADWTRNAWKDSDEVLERRKSIGL